MLAFMQVCGLLVLVSRSLAYRAFSSSPSVRARTSMRNPYAITLSPLRSSWDDFGDMGEDMFGGADKGPVGDVEKKCIFVGNLPFETTDQDLRKLVEEKGVSGDAILSSRIATKFNGRSRGFGYLEFSSSNAASENLEALVGVSKEEGGLHIGDRTLKLDLDVGLDGPNKGRRHARTYNDFSLFLGNLDFACDSLVVEDFIREMLQEKVTRELNIMKNKEQMRRNREQNKAIDEEEEESEGGDDEDNSRDEAQESTPGTAEEIESLRATPLRVKIAKDAVSGRSRGFAKAYFDSERSRDFALEALQMTELNGRELTVAVSKKRSNDEDSPWGGGASSLSSSRSGRKEADPDARNSRSIFVGNLPFEATADSVVDMVEDVLGPNRIVSVRLAQDPYTGRPKGYGHLDLKSVEDCERAVSLMDGMNLSGRPLRVDFASNSNANKSDGGGGGRDGARGGGGGGVARGGGGGEGPERGRRPPPRGRR